MAKTKTDSRYPHTAPTMEKNTKSYRDEEYIYRHNSFGAIKVYRTQGGDTALFGSALKHGHYISIEINRSHLVRHLYQDWISDDEEILRFQMSEAQWAQFVSSIGVGSGTPITFDRAPAPGTPLEIMDRLIQEPVKQTFDREIEESVRKRIRLGTEALAKFQALAAAKTVSKTELKEALAILERHMQHLPGDMAFLQRQFAESMEKTIMAGKTEIETFVQGLAMQTGLDVLRSQGVQLIESKEDGTDRPQLKDLA